jgi:Mrp family chromosome partitioning ATPase
VIVTAPIAVDWAARLDAAVEAAESGSESLNQPTIHHDILEATRRAQLRLAPRLPKQGVLAVASPHRGEGRTAVAAAMAMAIALDRDASVLLLDLDSARPGQARLFGVAGEPGIGESAIDGAPLRLVAGLPGRQLALIPAGSQRPPLPLTYRVRDGALLAAARERFSWVVIDLPPLLDYPEGSRIIREADAYILIGRYRKTTVRDVEQAVELLQGGKPAGFLLTGERSRIPRRIKQLF